MNVTSSATAVRRRAGVARCTGAVALATLAGAAPAATVGQSAARGGSTTQNADTWAAPAIAVGAAGRSGAGAEGRELLATGETVRKRVVEIVGVRSLRARAPRPHP
jgi:hypothetical protein